jgi:hypothetical protein
MAYWVHAWCTADTVPCPADWVAWVHANTEFAEAKMVGTTSRGLQSTKWTFADLLYDPAVESLAVECVRNTGPRSNCARYAADELTNLEEVKDSKAKRRVAGVLRKVTFCVTCTVSNDWDHDEADRVRRLLDFFVDSCGAVLDTEDEGFYARSGKPLLGLCAGGD